MDVRGIASIGRGRPTGFFLLLVLLSLIMPIRAAGAPVELYKKYLEAAQKAVESECSGDRLAALENYKSALEWLERTGAVSPGWFPEIVGSRAAECMSNIKRISGEIEKGTGGDEAIPSDVSAEAVGRRESAAEGAYSGLVEELCRRADGLYEKGLYTDACREYEMVLKLDPGHPRANFQLGLIYSENIVNRGKMEEYWARYRAASHSDMGDIYSKDGRYLTAIEQYNEALREAPGNTAIRQRLADAYFEQKRYAEALREYGAVLLADPGDLYSRFQIARIHAERGSAAKAVSELDFIMKRSMDYPGLDELYARIKAMSGDKKGAIACYEKVIDGAPSDTGPYLELAGLYEEERQDTRGAVDILALGAARFPGSTRLANEMGRCYVKMGDYTGARRAYESVLERVPDDVDSLIGLGIISAGGGSMEIAEELFRKALGIQPASAQALFHIASCQESRGDIEGAVKSLEDAVQHGTDRMDVYIKLADMYETAGEADKTASTLRRAIQRAPAANDLRKRLIALHMAAGKKDAAIEELKRYVEQGGRNAPAFVELGNLCCETGKEGDALSAYREAILLDPSAKGLSRKIAILHHRRAEYAPAIEAYVRAIEEEPGSPLLHNNIAVCYARRNMFSEAIREYEKALALDSDFAEVHIDLAKIYGDRLEKPKKAIEHCCSYLRLRPDGAHASIAKEMLITRKETMGK